MHSCGVTNTAIDLTRAARRFHALSDATRLGILQMLGDGERCVCDLQGDLDAAQSRLSFHLMALKDAGLVTDRKEARWSYYTLMPDTLGEMHDVILVLGTEQSKGRRLKILGRCCG